MNDDVAMLSRTDIPLRIRRSPRARRISLKIDAKLGAAVLVVPPGVSERTALRFAEEQRHWLSEQWGKLPRSVPFIDGAVIPLRGTDHTIRHQGTGRGTVEARDGALLVYGHAEHLSRRLTDWLKREARHDLNRISQEKAALLGRPIGRVSIRDQKSRWGSCAVNGNLSFNWRLILAPEFVLEYVAAHEVAHLAEHNHSPDFWRTVDRLTGHRRAGRAWLVENGAALHRYGQPVTNLAASA